MQLQRAETAIDLSPVILLQLKTIVVVFKQKEHVYLEALFNISFFSLTLLSTFTAIYYI